MKSHCTHTYYITKGPTGNTQKIPEMTDEEFRKLAHEQGLDTPSNVTVRILTFLKNSEVSNVLTFLSWSSRDKPKSRLLSILTSW
jgi:hypothetical protein